MSTCPHSGKDHLLFSGTKLRKALSEAQDLPEHFSRPEALEILRNYYSTLQNINCC
jgi:sulfate adenylyltransferase